MAQYDENEEQAGDEIHDSWLLSGSTDIYDICERNNCLGYINRVADYCNEMYDLDIYNI